VYHDFDLDTLCAETASLSENLLRRAAAACCLEVSETTLPKAKAAVNGVIHDFLLSTEGEKAREIVRYDGGSRKIMDLLTRASMTALASTLPRKPVKSRPSRKVEVMVRRPDLRLVHNTSA
jgi:hypothetical protein